MLQREKRKSDGVEESRAIENIQYGEILHPKDGESRISFKKPGMKEKLEEIARLKGER